jgi:hypothetical protein
MRSRTQARRRFGRPSKGITAAARATRTSSRPSSKRRDRQTNPPRPPNQILLRLKKLLKDRDGEVAERNAREVAWGARWLAERKVREVAWRVRRLAERNVREAVWGARWLAKAVERDPEG